MHRFCELFISKAAIKQLFVAAVKFRQVRKFVARVGIADRKCHVNVHVVGRHAEKWSVTFTAGALS